MITPELSIFFMWESMVTRDTPSSCDICVTEMRALRFSSATMLASRLFNLHHQAAICGGLRLHTANLQRSGLHPISLRTVSIVSASLAGLSHLIRLTLGNRKAMPDL